MGQYIKLNHAILNSEFCFYIIERTLFFHTIFLCVTTKCGYDFGKHKSEGIIMAKYSHYQNSFHPALHNFERNEDHATVFLK